MYYAFKANDMHLVTPCCGGNTLKRNILFIVIVRNIFEMNIDGYHFFYLGMFDYLECLHTRVGCLTLDLTFDIDIGVLCSVCYSQSYIMRRRTKQVARPVLILRASMEIKYTFEKQPTKNVPHF